MPINLIFASPMQISAQTGSGSSEYQLDSAYIVARRAAYIVRIWIESPWNPGQIYLLVQGNRVSAQERILPTNKTVAEEELDLDDIGSFVL